MEHNINSDKDSKKVLALYDLSKYTSKVFLNLNSFCFVVLLFIFNLTHENHAFGRQLTIIKVNHGVKCLHIT